MIVGEVSELTIASILNRGVPNQECVAISVKQYTNMGQFGMMLGHFSPNVGAQPYSDNLFWFGAGNVKLGDWLFVFTGSGTPSKSKAVNGINDLFSLFWGKPTTVFAQSSIVPILFRVDAVNVLYPPSDQPQFMAPQQP